MKEILERLERKMDAGFAQVDRRFEQVDARFEQVDKRFEQVDRRFEQVDKRFEQVDVQLEDGRERDRGFEARFDRVDAQLQKQGVLLEAVQGDVKMALEGIIGNREISDKGFADVMRKLDERVQPIELVSRKFSRELSPRAKSAAKRRRS